MNTLPLSLRIALCRQAKTQVATRGWPHAAACHLGSPQVPARVRPGVGDGEETQSLWLEEVTKIKYH